MSGSLAWSLFHHSVEEIMSDCEYLVVLKERVIAITIFSLELRMMLETPNIFLTVILVSLLINVFLHLLAMPHDPMF